MRILLHVTEVERMTQSNHYVFWGGGERHESSPEELHQSSRVSPGTNEKSRCLDNEICLWCSQFSRDLQSALRFSVSSRNFWDKCCKMDLTLCKKFWVSSDANQPFLSESRVERSGSRKLEVGSVPSELFFFSPKIQGCFCTHGPSHYNAMYVKPIGQVNGRRESDCAGNTFFSPSHPQIAAVRARR